jgi:putative membrane protein
MQQLVSVQLFFFLAHIFSMAFGLAGLLIVLPNAEFISHLSSFGQTLFQLGMSGGGVIYIIFGAIAVSIYAYRTLGLKPWLAFMLPAVFLSLGSELLGTSTGFPFGNYGYLNGLGYKIAGLVPFTIPLSWFYLGFAAYVLARAGLKVAENSQSWGRQVGAIALGSLLLTSWDFVLDPAMSQTISPFWVWYQPGAFFGMPYSNFAGWFGTGVVFISIAAFLWQKLSLPALRELNFPLGIYLSNFAFAAIMSVGSGFLVPTALGLIVGVFPALILWWQGQKQVISSVVIPATLPEDISTTPVKVALK